MSPVALSATLPATLAATLASESPMSGKQSESPRRPHIADDLMDQLGESVREQVELSRDFLDDETIEQVVAEILRDRRGNSGGAL